MKDFDSDYFYSICYVDMMGNLDIPLEVLQKMPSYYQPPVNCPLHVHQSIMRQIYHCKRVIKKSDFSINFK